MTRPRPVISEVIGDCTLWSGDCRHALKHMQAGGRVFDAVVTDPPYEWGMMSKKWDSTGVAFQPETWKAVYDVMKPGAYLLAMGGPRTYHRLACAIGDAGFDVKDCIAWLFGSGWPKSENISKRLDRRAGAGREVIRENYTCRKIRAGADVRAAGQWGKQDVAYTAADTAPATDAARKWNGFGTSLKPAMELVCLAQRPLDGTYVDNILKHGCGALNIDASRVASDVPGPWRGQADPRSGTGRVVYNDGWRDGSFVLPDTTVGRWPANVILDDSDEVQNAFAAFGDSSSGNGAIKKATGAGYQSNIYGKETHPAGTPMICHGDTGTAARFFQTCESDPPPRGKRPGGFGDVGHDRGDPIPNGPTYGDEGSPSRFFYTSKAGTEDRCGSKHPTVKPLSLCRYLLKLACPPGGHVLDPFAGSGTTLQAAYELGMLSTGCEAEAEYQNDIRRRITRIQWLRLAGQ